MAEYINRKELLDLIERWREVRANPYNERDNMLIDAMLYAVRSAPVADVAPIVEGYWYKEASYFDVDCHCMFYGYSCSNCGEIVTDKPNLPKYCPNCGSRNEVTL